MLRGCVLAMRGFGSRLARAPLGAFLNIAEGAGRRSRADKSRVYAIALGELCEAAAAVELARVFGNTPAEDVARTLRLAVRVKDLLSRLIG